MSSRGKTRSSEFSSPSKTSTKRIKESSSSRSNRPQEEDLMTKIVEQVLERLSESMEKAIERLVDKAVKSVNQALVARIAALEAKIEDRLSSNQHCNERQHSGPGESNSALQNQILRLQHSGARQEHAANFVMSGVPEKESTADERPENSVLQACKDLQIPLSVSDLVEVRRLGRPSQDISRSRPRPLLVKTATQRFFTWHILTS